MPELGETKSTVFNPGQTDINPVEAARRELAQRETRNAMILQRLRQQAERDKMQADLAREQMGLQRELPGIAAQADLARQGGSQMDILGQQGEQAIQQQMVANEPSMAQVGLAREAAEEDRRRFDIGREDASIARTLSELAMLEQLSEQLPPSVLDSIRSRVLSGEDIDVGGMLEGAQGAPAMSQDGGTDLVAGRGPGAVQEEQGTGAQAAVDPADSRASILRNAYATLDDPDSSPAEIDRARESIEFIESRNIGDDRRMTEAQQVIDVLQSIGAYSADQQLRSEVDAMMNDNTITSGELGRLREIRDEQYGARVDPAEVVANDPDAQAALESAIYDISQYESNPLERFLGRTDTIPQESINKIDESVQVVMEALRRAGVPDDRARQWIEQTVPRGRLFEEILLRDQAEPVVNRRQKPLVRRE
jgi:hypothetical protein